MVRKWYTTFAVIGYIRGKKWWKWGVQDLCGVSIMAPSGRGLPRERVGERQKDWQQLAGLSLPQSASLTAPSQREPFALHTLARPLGAKVINR